MAHPAAPVEMQQPGSEMKPVQGQGGGWMPVAQQPQMTPTQCPAGLEYLTQIDQLLVKQKVEVFEAFSGYETNNRYDVTNTMGQSVYYVAEDTCCCTRNCCGDRRPFDLKVLDNGGKEVMHMESPLRCDSCWCPCCLRKVVVTAPPGGQTIGIVRQGWSLLRPYFKIQDANDETVLTIEGPICHCKPCGDVEFKVGVYWY